MTMTIILIRVYPGFYIGPIIQSEAIATMNKHQEYNSALSKETAHTQRDRRIEAFLYLNRLHVVESRNNIVEHTVV
jgi:hypothetical protein